MGVKLFTIAQIATALRKHDGFVPRAAAELKTSRQTLHERIARSSELQGVLSEIDEDMRGYARGTIFTQLKAGDGAMARWYAERKMRDEGYGSRVEVGIDTAALEALAAAIAKGGPTVIRAAIAAIASSHF